MLNRRGTGKSQVKIMKIEKLSENQIRCTLTRADLAARNLRISELAYGSEKTQNLFREMVKQADYEYGFETENMPIMVEAIPVSADAIVLIITKIEDPEELDTRFSRFSPYNNPADEDDDFDEDGDDYVSDIFEKAAAKTEPSFGEMLGEAIAESAPKHGFVFTFSSLSRVMDFAKQAKSFSGESSLFKSSEGYYLLVIRPENIEKSEFKNVCLLASEYAKGRSITNTACDFMKEHNDTLIPSGAISKLA